MMHFFVSPGTLSTFSLDRSIGLISHPLGHQDWTHLLANFSLILLLGPILEEKYGSSKMLIMILITAIITGLLNLAFYNTGLIGASGIAFMLIILSSITNYKNGDIPITFILVMVLYLGKEFMNSTETDNISQFAHIIGGILGSVFGFVINKKVINSDDQSIKTKDITTLPELTEEKTNSESSLSQQKDTDNKSSE